MSTLQERIAKAQAAIAAWPAGKLETMQLQGPCNCVGPQNGQPLCPCQMRGVTVENGRYVRRVDLGPAPHVFVTNPAEGPI